jgi:hypothetical protein
MSSGRHLLSSSSSGFDPDLGLTFRLRPPQPIGFWPLRHSRLPNLIVGNLVGFMYFEEAVPAAKCDALAYTYL